VPSAPPQSGGKLGVKVPDGDTPISAGIGTGKGRKSFLRPFLLGGRRKKGEMPASVMHKSRKEEEFDVPKSQDGFERVRDDHLQVDLEVPESPYEETAFISKDDGNGHGDDVGQDSPVWAPLAAKGKKGTSKRVAEMRIDEVIPSSPGVATSNTPSIPLTPVTPVSPVSPPIVTSPMLSPVPTPATALIQLSPIEAQVPMSPIPITPITPSQANTTPPSPIGTTPNTPIPITPITTGKSSTHRESESRLGHGRDRHHRNREETSDERRKRKERERELSKREKGSGENISRPSRSEVEKEDTWLEVVFEDLPFGPDKNMVSASFFPFFPFPSFSTLSAARL